MTMRVMIGMTTHDDKAYAYGEALACMGRLWRETMFSNICIAAHWSDAKCREIDGGIGGRVPFAHVIPLMVPVHRGAVEVPVNHEFAAPTHEMVYVRNIVMARNILRSAALLSEKDYLFFLDADVVVEPSAVVRMLDCDAPVVTCPLPLRQWRVNEAGGVDKGPPEVLPWHLGAVLIRADVLRQIEFRFEWSRWEGVGVTAGDDICFYRDCMKHGFEVKIMPGIRAMHYLSPEAYPMGWDNADGGLHLWEGGGSAA